MSVEFLTLLFFGALLLFVLLGTPLVFVLGGVSVIFLYFELGSIGFYLVSNKMWETMSNPTLMAIPLFVFMATLLEKSGVAGDLYDMMHKWFGGLRGGLAIGTVMICVIFAAMSGISGAAVVTMGTIALPKMLERGYDKKLALGAINAGGGWGILIPPSILMVLFALLTEISAGRLFAAGIGPGLLLFVLVSIYIVLRCLIQPEMGPALPRHQRADWPEKFRALRAVILPILIVLSVLGAIFGGFATPTEAAAIGVFGALVATLVNRQLRAAMLFDAAVSTLRLTAMIMWILFAAHAFSTAYTALGAQTLIEHLMTYVPGGKWGALAFMLGVLFLFGMVLDPVGIMLITLPVFLPVARAYGFDPIWFGILFIIMMEVGYMTPPFGFNLFYLRGVAPPDVTMADIYQSVIPYVLVTLLGVLLIILFPEIALYLPRLFYG
ncbi:TRAP transporter, DctM subunit [Gemmobacter megaterium]|uniref:TRAP transporter large permease protein n=1 Tax=Gemmobacter megaterium TaxID=1086013 RepID=A0A1N7N1A6_9RHOB|nr:TRAP transporter large permease subunit [Gemmobacter megaterium]GGE12420.1 tripartite transporter large subunit [Gemmobacter megaterium]SIS92105.1 TRAP transporter, DctM subunit [Gemmobacter megaterium]